MTRTKGVIEDSIKSWIRSKKQNSTNTQIKRILHILAHVFKFKSHQWIVLVYKHKGYCKWTIQPMPTSVHVKQKTSQCVRKFLPETLLLYKIMVADEGSGQTKDYLTYFKRKLCYLSTSYVTVKTLIRLIRLRCLC